MPAETIDSSALWLAAPHTPEYRVESVPPPGPGEVRVGTIASALSQGTEMLVYRGQVPKGTPLDLPTFKGSFAFPIKYGYAAVGRVIDAGPGVEGIAPGDAVFVHHPHQEVFVVPASMPVRLPGGIDPMLGVFTANLETAVNVLLDTPLHLGEAAAVFGLGTVGLLVAQLLMRAGADPVIGIDPIEMRRQVARRVGIGHTLAPGEDLQQEISRLTRGRGADVAVEVSGTGAGLQSAIDTLAEEGSVVAVSWYGAKPVTLQLGGHFHRGRVRVISSQVGRLNPVLSPRWDRARRMEMALDLLTMLPLAKLISHRIPFEQAPEAYRLVDESPGETVQVVLTYGDSR